MSPYLDVLEKNLQRESYVQILKRIEIPLKKFSEEILLSSSLNFSNISTIYSELLGVGQGSTPQSDDIFLGVITTISIMDPKIKEKLVRLAVMKYEDFTTKKSSILIRKFLRGNFPEEIQKLVNLLRAKNRIDEFTDELRRVKAIGASSGLFFLVGLLWQLKYYENHK